jgi:ABC-2 type transport system ATP-binding protein
MTDPHPWAIEAQGLTKIYTGDVLAVEDLDLRVATNTIYALLGPNGAGKTTTISMLTTLIEPTSGTATVAGYDVTRQPNDVRRHIGVTFQDIVLDRDLTGRQVLDVHGRLYRMDKAERERRIDELVDLVELGDAVDRLVKTYSGGMKRRLELARGLLTQPQILFLDEPTLGLDPQNRAKLWEYIEHLKSDAGLTLLVTTHYMEEAETLADTVGIIDHGNLITEGTPQELIDEMGADVIRIAGHGDHDQFITRVQALPFVDRVNVTDNIIQIGVDNGNHRLPDVVTAASGNGYVIEDISVAKPSLGDVFLKYTGRQLRDK